jgi:hypothetical protein
MRFSYPFSWWPRSWRTRSRCLRTCRAPGSGSAWSVCVVVVARQRCTMTKEDVCRGTFCAETSPGCVKQELRMNVEQISEQRERERNVERLASVILRHAERRVATASAGFVPIDLDRDEWRAVGTVLCAVIGDALGSNCEFKSFEQIESQFGVVRNFVHSSWRPKGMFTDDGESTSGTSRCNSRC